MKRFSYACVFFITLACISCGKTDTTANKKLATNYFKSALVELSDPQAGTYHHKKALAFVEQALVCDKKSHYFAMKATLLFKLDQYDESSATFDQALACCDDNYLKAEITNNYACLLAQQGQLDKAIEMFKGLSIDRYYLTPEVALVNLGKIHVEKNDHKTAQACLHQAIIQAPQYLDAHFYLALSAYFNKDMALAKQEVKTILYLDPLNKAACELDKELMAV